MVVDVQRVRAIATREIYYAENRVNCAAAGAADIECIAAIAAGDRERRRTCGRSDLESIDTAGAVDGQTGQAAVG